MAGLPVPVKLCRQTSAPTLVARLLLVVTLLTSTSHSTQAQEGQAPAGPQQEIVKLSRPRTAGPGHRSRFDEHDCVNRKLLLTYPAYWASFADKIRFLRLGLTLAAAAGRTLVLPPLRGAAGGGPRYADLFDTERLRAFWPCFLETDDGADLEELYDDMFNGSHVEHGFWPEGDDYMAAWPKPADARAPPALADAVAWATSGAPARAPILRVDSLGFLCGGDWRQERSFWASLAPSAALAQEVAAFRIHALLEDDPFGALLLPTAQGSCEAAATQTLAGGELTQAAAVLCAPDAAGVVRRILGAKGLPATSRFLVAAGGHASPSLDQLLREVDTMVYRQAAPADWAGSALGPWVRGYGGGRVFLPAAELWLAAQADVAVGLLASAFAQAVADLRAAQGRETVLAWPEPAGAAAPYWQCNRAAFFCGGALAAQPISIMGGPWSVLDSARRTDCYPRLTDEEREAAKADPPAVFDSRGAQPGGLEQPARNHSQPAHSRGGRAGRRPPRGERPVIDRAARRPLRRRERLPNAAHAAPRGRDARE